MSRLPYHEIWITGLQDRLFVSFTKNPDALFEEVKHRNYGGKKKPISSPSRARLLSIIKYAQPQIVYLHPDGPSLTYRFKRGTIFPAPASVVRILEAA